MKKQEMLDTLTKQGQELKNELAEMQQTFVTKIIFIQIFIITKIFIAVELSVY